MESDLIQEISTDDFVSIEKTNEPYILDFYSSECAPCESLAPKYEEMAKLFGSKIRFYKIFRQNNRDLAKKLGVSSSPTVLFFSANHENKGRLTGAIHKKDILDKIHDLISEDEFKASLQKKEKKTKFVDVAILGGGPAGMSAAIYASQAKLHTAIIDSELTGGQVKTTHLISNYPGTGTAVNGYELMDKMLSQAKESGSEILAAVDITSIELSPTGEVHKIILDGGDLEVVAKSVILSTGAQPGFLGAEGEKELRGNGISYCATCDGKYYEDREIVVIGGGNSAVEETQFLSRFANKIQIIQNLENLTANKTAIERLLKNEKVSILYNTTVTQFEKLESGKMKLTLKNLHTGEISFHQTDGVFVFIGMKPNTQSLGNLLTKDSYGYIVTNEDMETNLPGVYAVGDLRSKKFRQAATAVGDGCIAGIIVEKYIEEFDARIKRIH